MKKKKEERMVSLLFLLFKNFDDRQTVAKIQFTSSK